MCALRNDRSYPQPRGVEKDPAVARRALTSRWPAVRWRVEARTLAVVIRLPPSALASASTWKTSIAVNCVDSRRKCGADSSPKRVSSVWPVPRSSVRSRIASIRIADEQLLAERPQIAAGVQVTAKLNTIFPAKFGAEYKIYMFIERLGKEGRKDSVMLRITPA